MLEHKRVICFTNTEFLCFVEGKGKGFLVDAKKVKTAVPLEARGVQRVPGS
jgi:hypothetical protein